VEIIFSTNFKTFLISLKSFLTVIPQRFLISSKFQKLRVNLYIIIIFPFPLTSLTCNHSFPFTCQEFSTFNISPKKIRCIQDISGIFLILAIFPLLKDFGMRKKSFSREKERSKAKNIYGIPILFSAECRVRSIDISKIVKLRKIQHI